MRTSGAGGRDILMLGVPVAALVLAVMIWFGGPRTALRMAEMTLDGALRWVADFF